MIAAENQALSARTTAASLATGPAVGGVLSASSAAAVPTRKYVPLPSKQQLANNANSKEAVKKDVRARKILQQISLSVERFDNLFHMDPLSRYELATREKQKGRTRDMGSQYNEDWLSQEVQTEEIDTYTLGAQVPDDLSAKVLVARESSATSTSTSTGTGPDDSHLQQPAAAPLSTLSTARLTSFLSSAAQVMDALLQENLSLSSGGGAQEGRVGAAFTQPAGPLGAISNASLSLRAPAIFGPRTIKDVVFSRQRCHTILVAYSRVDLTRVAHIPPNTSTAKAPFEGTAHKGLILIWDLLSPTYPTKVLLLDGTPSCVGCDHARAHIIFAGTEEGSIAVWDLREDTAVHRCLLEPNLSEEGSVGHTHVLRQASFSTDYMATENHESSVRRILSLTEHDLRAMLGQNSTATDDGDVGGDGALASSATSFSLTGGTLSSNFQFSSLDEIGGLYVWTGIELHNVDPAGSEIDLGLREGAKIKLVRSAVLLTSAAVSQQSFSLAFKPDEPNEYLVSLGRGLLRRGRRYGEKAAPSEYVQFGGGGGKDDCASVDFHPIWTQYFLAGFKSGAVSLFHVSSSRALATWLSVFGPTMDAGYAGPSSGVVQVQWSSFRPSVFVALDARGQMVIFDLVHQQQKSVATAQLTSPPESTATIEPPPPVLALSSRTGQSTSQSAHLLAFPTSSADGHAVTVHALKPAFSQVTEPERQKFAEYLRHVHASA